MNERSERIDGARALRRTGHEEVWDLLPWYVNDTLDEEEARTVAAHLEGCGICREEVRYWGGFARALQEEGDLAVSADAGLARLRRHLAGAGPEREMDRAPRRPPAGARERLRRGSAGLRDAPAPLRWALAAQLAAILILGGLLASAWTGPAPSGADAPPADAPGAFRTLSGASTPAAVSETRRLRVVFADQAREREIRGALIAVGGRIVDGPSPTGVYTVAVDERGDGEATLETLRSFSQVRFAERAATSAEVP